MINPAAVRAFFTSSGLGIGLCLVILFLIGNTLYLQNIRDSKATAAENLALIMENYQDVLQAGGKNPLPAKARSQASFGSILKPAVQAFKASGEIIRLEQIDVDEISEEMPRNHKRKRQEPVVVQVLKMSGHIQSGQSDEPYTKLNEVISEIKKETGCQFTLEKAAIKEIQQDEPIEFQISLKPDRQPACLKGNR